MIDLFSAENYKCLKNVTIPLTPLHAFIGPNDAGKSTILKAIRTVMHFASSLFLRGPVGAWTPFDPELDLPGPEPKLVCLTKDGSYGIGVSDHLTIECARTLSQDETKHGSRSWNSPPNVWLNANENTRRLRAHFCGVRMMDLEVEAMRAPAGPTERSANHFDLRGLGLAVDYARVLMRADDAKREINDEIRKHFRDFERIGVEMSGSLMSFDARLVDGTNLDALELGQGVLTFLAFLLLEHLPPVSLLLVEHPERGLHPAQVNKVILMLRRFIETTGTQVLIATHSPLVINELRPEEVSIITRPSLKEGTRVTRFVDVPNFETRSQIYNLGELWLAYADGVAEEPLLAPQFGG